MLHRTCLLAAALALCAPNSVLAQSQGVSAAPAVLFSQGLAALELGDYKNALSLFRASQEAEPGKGKLLNIAVCEEKLGLVATATQEFQQVLLQLDPNDERRAAVARHLTDLGPRIPHLQVILATGAPPDTSVTLDGALLDATKLGTEMPVDPGAHVIATTATDRPERRYDVVVNEGKTFALMIEPGTPDPPKPAPIVLVVVPKPSPPSDEPKPRSNTRTLGFVVGGLGTTSLVVGGITGILALLTHSAIESECPKHVDCSQDVINKASTGKSLSTASVLALSVGAVGAGVGVYLVLSGSKSPGAPTAGLMVFPDGGRFGVRGSF
jgi:hypothetical protein